jgi:predicted acyl esterase
MRLLLLLVTLIALVLPAVAGAADPPAPYTVKTLTINAQVGPQNKTKCAVAADLYTPTGVDKDHPAAAILGTNGFGGSKDDFKAVADSYARRGYVFLAYSGLGFGGSQCKIELDSPVWDGKAASWMIDFLGGHLHSTTGFTPNYVIHDPVDHDGKATAFDPRVGMMGGSYGGEVQFAAASVDPRLDTIIPQITWNNLAYSLAPNNTATTSGVTYAKTAPGAEKVEWTTLFFGLGIADGAQAFGGGDQTHLTGTCPNFDDQACSAKAKMDLLGYPDAGVQDFALGASVTSYMAKIKIPTFLAQGQADTLFNEQEAVATYQALRAQGTPVKMLWKFNGHSSSALGTSEDSDTNPESAYASRAYLAWYDYYLLGKGSPPALDFSYYRDYVPFPAGGDAAPAVTTVPAYPAAPDATWYLSGTNALVSDPSKITAGSAQFLVNPQGPASYTETSAADQSGPVTDAPGTFASFASAPLAKDTDVVGIPKITVTLDAPTFAGSQDSDPAGKLVLFAKLYDVAPDGTIDLPHRLISPVRVADVTKPVTIALPGIVHRFPAGHTMEFVLAASDAAYRGNTLPGPVTVVVDPKAPTVLSVPTLSESVAPPAPVGAPAGTQQPGAGVQPAVFVKPSSVNPACQGTRKLRIPLRIKHDRRHDRVLFAIITLDGKNIRTVRGRALLGPVVLKKRSKHHSYRALVTERTKRGLILHRRVAFKRSCG